jgi:cytochrome c-type biogenesis protein CcmH
MFPTLRLFLLFLGLAAVLAPGAQAVSSPDELLANPAQEQRAERLGGQLRCLVCQNESIEESDADLARDLRHDIRVHIVAGDSDAQIIDWMTARYGNFVRLRPPFTATTLLLWLSPLLAVGVGVAAVLVSRRQRTAAAAPLSGDEQRKLAELLRTP